VSDLLQRLRRRGWRLTAQRRAVAEVFAGEHVHLTADEVLARAAGRLPEISRATVYNTLRELVTMGELLHVSIGGRPKLYDPKVHESHQHLVCYRCGLVRDVHAPNEAALTLPRRERHGFLVAGVDVIFRGVCSTCAGARPSASRTHRAKNPRR
jgi:Fur family ferric uptake transcriptional regulator